MNRILALALAACSLAALTSPSLAQPMPVDQAGWNSMKKEVRLSNGIRLSYVEAGDPNGEPLLLLHGFTDSSRSFSLMTPYLGRYRLLIPDQRGHGASDAPECCYNSSQFAYDARLFLDALGVRRAAIAGHSLGSMVAISLAADNPERVSQLILIGSTALVPVERGDWLYDNVAAMRGPLDPNSRFAKDWHPANQPTRVDPAFADAVNAELYAIPERVWHGVMREISYVPVGRHAADVKAPVLVISGGRDPLFPSQHHRSLLKAFPNARSEIFADLGHNPNWERPREVAAVIKAFLGANR
ncbi:MAG TPA: alpha/beta hydrolase [Sphingomicrobium sp.]|nr:alpha/beta hydrolase [Sphingomicrobium sp.]